VSGPVLVERREHGAILHLTLDAPKGNVLDAAMLGAIADALGEHGHAPSLRAIAFEGAGKHFSFGASIPEHLAESAPAMLEAFHGVFRRLLELAVPTAAIVRGMCLGGGLELASFCSWIFASPDAKLGQPEIKLAVFPPMASLLLPWRLGGGPALDLCVSGRTIGANEARRIGLVHSVSDDPAATWLGLFHAELAPLSASSLRFAERAARLDLAHRLERDLPALERLYLDELMASRDANEGLAAYLDKRKPVWSDG
jgi:cyclohexa-1,5-dienecarbonyl-CoA hydratase